MNKNQQFLKRFSYALNGIRIGLGENSFRTQLVFCVLAFVLLVLTMPSPEWWAIVVLLCGAILAAELFNTALEAVCDHVSPQFAPAIKVAKDAAAGAVLVLSFAALLIAAILIYNWLFP